MADYTQIKADMWQDPEFESLTPQAKLLWLNLLTTPARNTAGLYHMSLRRMAFETGLAENLVANAVGQLAEQGWIRYHEPSGVVWIRNFIKRQPWSETIRTKVLRDIANIGEDHPLARELREYYRELLDAPSRNVEIEACPIDTPSIPHAGPIDTPSMGSARGNGTERNGTKDLSEGAPNVAATPVENSEASGAKGKPPDNRTDGQRLVALYVDERVRLGHSRPTRRQVGLLADVVGQKLAGGAKPPDLEEAIRRLVAKGKPPSCLPAFVDEVEAEAVIASARPDYAPVEPLPEMTPEEREASARAAREALERIRALASGVGREIE